jgi:hypothetical protein
MNSSTRIILLVLVLALAAAVAFGAYRAGQRGEEETPEPPVVAGGCIVGGCSAQLCTEESEGPAVSDCMFRPEYACYKQAKCERQPSGQCGWTPTAALTTCLANPPQPE